MSVTTGVVRASFVHIYQAVAPQGGGEPKYSITLLIPKSDVNTLRVLAAEIEQVKQANAQQFGGQTAGLKVPLYDGDGVMPSGAPWGAECRGCMVLRASSKEQPAIVDGEVQPLLNPNAVYSGCYVRASVNLYAYNQPMNKGIGCGLNAVQKIADGEPLANRVSPEEAFGGANAYSGNAVPVGQGIQPGAYQPPAASQQPALPGAYQPPAASVAGAYPQAGAPAGYPYPAAPAIDPVTGKPAVPGGVMGI